MERQLAQLLRQRRGFPPSRTTKPFASRSSWTHFTHQPALSPFENSACGRRADAAEIISACVSPGLRRGKAANRAFRAA